tara:strand:+ start:162 stop:302 length:141 start_codon:yes stop_codon:yes gene_type:complete
VLNPVQGHPFGEFFRRHPVKHLGDRHAEILSEPEIEAALRIAAAET